MSGIVLSSSVRQNLLSLQSTASLLATTQNDLATGNKVNSALDNPTNFFTAQSLNNRAGDISNLLDGIGNGVQVLQAANTGITSLQSLVASAQSIANQALQTTVGYSTLSNVSTTITGATASNLLGTTTFTNAVASSNVLYSGNAGGTTAATSSTKLGGVAGVLTGATLTGTTAASLLNGTAAAGDLNAGVAAGDSFTVNGKTVTFAAGDAPGTAPTGFSQIAAVGGKTTGNVFTDASGNSVIYLGSTSGTKASVGDVTTAIDIASGAQSNVAGTLTLNSGQTASTSAAGLVLKSSTGADLNISGKADFLHTLGLTSSLGSGTVTVTAARTTASTTAGNLIQDGSTLNVDGHVITFKNAPAPAASASHTGVNGAIETDGNGNSTVYLQTATVGDLTNAIDLATGAQTATLGTSSATLKAASGSAVSSINTSGQLQISTGLNADLSITGTGNALSALGLGGNTGTATSFTAARGAGTGGITGKTLTFSSFNGGTAVNVTFGTGAGQVQTLNDLNTALQADNLNATLDANGVLKISAANDYASSTLGSTQAGGAIGGTLTSALNFSSASAPVADAAAQATRANLVQQYNNVLQQINTTAQDSSFNGVNLLNGDQLKLVFNETGKSTLNITGVTFNSAGLGLSNLVQGSDFIDNNATNKVLSSLTAASTTLRSEASSLGSNLSIVQIRQDFSKNIINVLQTGSSNLTLADTNAEAANSQALSTRQSIAVSALALANQSQQSVLQLLR
jgi:flagellin